MNITTHDRDILRRLAEHQAEIAQLPIQKETAELWRKLNDLEPVRPLIWINEIPWHEMNVDDELTLQCTDPWCQEIETRMRRTLYQWKHMRGDMIVSDYIAAPLVIHSTGFGLQVDEDVLSMDAANAVVSHGYKQQFKKPEDVEKIKMPVVTHDEAASAEQYQAMCHIFDGILPVRQEGKKGIWCAPWDVLVMWYGVQEALLDLVLRPEMIHALMDRLIDAYNCELDQWVALNVLTRNDDNTRGGSGGYGYTNDLPAPGHDPAQVRPADMWGNIAAQIFTDVSPAMHWEFALQYELRWMERWGLTYYGCCDRLDRKMELMHKIPNLRKVSMSPFVDVEKGAAAVGTDYVFSLKPNPSYMGEGQWRSGVALAELRNHLEITRGCHVEIILKDLSTTQYEPQRIWEWTAGAMEMVQEFAP